MFFKNKVWGAIGALFANSKKRCDKQKFVTIAKPCFAHSQKFSIAQGTIEYLIIVAVVVVVSLVVVGLIVSQTDSVEQINSSSSQASLKVGVDGISVSSSVFGEDRNGVFVIKNLNPEKMILKNISVNEVDHIFFEPVMAGEEKAFKLQDLDLCNGTQKNYTVKVDYLSQNGLDKVADFETIVVECSPTATPKGVAVEEYKEPVCEGDEFLYRFPGSEYKKKCYSCSTNPSTGFFDNGSGAINNPFMICDWNQLNNVRYTPNSYFKLMTDLGTTDANYNDFATDWKAIGEPDYCDDGNCSTQETCEKETGCASTWRLAGSEFCAPNFTDVGYTDLMYSSYCSQNESKCNSECGGYWYTSGECSGDMSSYCTNHSASSGDCSSQNGCFWNDSVCSGDMSGYCGQFWNSSANCNSKLGCLWESWGGYCDGDMECYDYYDQPACQSHSPTCYWREDGYCGSNTSNCSSKDLETCANYGGCSIIPGFCSNEGTQCNYNWDESGCDNYPACDWEITYTQCELSLSGSAADTLCNSNSLICSDCYYYDSSWSNSGYGTWHELSEDVCDDLRCNIPETCERSYGCNSNWNKTTFSGVFDGKGFDQKNNSVQYLKVNNSGDDFSGLFGYVTGRVSNTILSDVNINGSNYVGGVVAHLNGGEVSDCDVNGVINSSKYAGGLVGSGENSSLIENSSATVTLTGNYYTGGLVGYLINSSLSASFFKGFVNAAGSESGGGLVGSFYSSNLNDCYAVGEFKGSASFTGSLFGQAVRHQLTNVFSSITRAYPLGSYKGYFGGYAQNVKFTNVYAVPAGYWGNMYGLYFQGDSYINSGSKSDADLKSYSTFKNDGWDIGLIDDYNGEKWVIEDGVNYPMLDWQLTR